MSEAVNLIHEVLDVFSGQKSALKEKEGGLVDVRAAARDREKSQRLECRKDCQYPAWAGGCPYSHTLGQKCLYYGENYKEEEE
jgi:hypothetical protein